MDGKGGETLRKIMGFWEVLVLISYCSFVVAWKWLERENCVCQARWVSRVPYLHTSGNVVISSLHILHGSKDRISKTKETQRNRLVRTSASSCLKGEPGTMSGSCRLLPGLYSWCLILVFCSLSLLLDKKNKTLVYWYLNSNLIL